MLWHLGKTPYWEDMSNSIAAPLRRKGPGHNSGRFGKLCKQRVGLFCTALTRTAQYIIASLGLFCTGQCKLLHCLRGQCGIDIMGLFCTAHHNYRMSDPSITMTWELSYSSFEWGKDNPAWEYQPALPGRTAQSCNLALPSFETAVHPVTVNKGRAIREAF